MMEMVLKEEEMEEGELLESIGVFGVNAVDNEKKIVESIEQRLNSGAQEIDEEDEEEKGADENELEVKADKVIEHKLPEKNSGGLKKKSKILLVDVEAETEETLKIKQGEMTPFGTLVEKNGPKKDSFLNFSKYMKDQADLQKQFKKSKKSSTKTFLNDDSNEPVQSTSKGSSRGRSSGKALKMNILFPKRRKKKVALGTGTSEDPMDSRMRPGKVASEKAHMYLNSSEDSDYIPSDDEVADEDFGGSSSKRSQIKRKSKKIASKHLKDSDPSDFDSDVERQPTKRLKREMDDGNQKFYENRVAKWKEVETRFTGEYKTFEGGFKVPMHLWESLYDYQKIGVKWLWELHEQRSGGILGDEMGLGKTIQVVAFLAGLACANVMFRFSKFRGLGPCLIICPVTVMHQWVKEFHTWWPPFKVVVLHESGSYDGTKKGLIRSIGRGILITSYVGVVHNKDEILKQSWDYVILDEGHKIRNPDAQVTLTVKQIPTPHRLILSGSPLQNNLKELWSLMDFVYPGKLGTLPTFIEQFSVPITMGGYASASQIQVTTAYKCATILRNLISPYLLRRLKSDVKNHINLPPKNEQVLFCKLAPEQKSLYINYINSKQVDSIMRGNFNLFAGLINLRKICNHPHLYDGGPKQIVPTKYAQNQKIPSNRIPKAKVLTPDSFTKGELSDEGSDIEISPDDSFGSWNKSGKMIVLETLLKLWSKQNHKVLLFSQSRQMLCIMENFLRQTGYTYLRMDGGTSIGSRQPLIKQFNEDPSIFVFLLTTKVGGLGINLCGANRVIIFDPDWNPSTDLQSVERSWRIGQLRQVTIYRLITSGTIEEKIYHRQIFKQYLTNRVLKDPKQKRFFKNNDLVELFSFNESTETGTESSAIFAGTGSSVKPKSRKKIKAQEAKEKSSGKFKNVPYLVKQRSSDKKKGGEEEEKDGEAPTSGTSQDEYVLRKLFKKTGVEGALKHDKIVSSEGGDDYIIEREAELVAKNAVKALKKSRDMCWSADSGRFNFTGNNGTIRRQKFGPKESTEKLSKKKKKEEKKKDKEDDLFSGPKTIEEKEEEEEPLTSTDILSMIRARKAKALVPEKRVELPPEELEEDEEEEDDEPEEYELEENLVENRAEGTSNTNREESDDEPMVDDDHVELIKEIREFISLRAMVDGEARTCELVEEFGPKLPPGDSPLFKKMLGELCDFHRDDGTGVWRLKPEFRY